MFLDWFPVYCTHKAHSKSLSRIAVTKIKTTHNKFIIFKTGSDRFSILDRIYIEPGLNR
ncbi:hypothetical protein Hanom_Chr12g01173511 [Helianthus anomalus]